MNEFNKNHPERAKDEVWITNLTYPDDFGYIGWETKRVGVVAYDANGNPIGEKAPDLVPVFVKQDEILSRDDGAELLARLLP